MRARGLRPSPARRGGGGDGGDGGAALTIVYSPPDVVDPSAGGGGGPAAFGGPASTDPNERPRVVYPLDGTMLARNIYQLPPAERHRRAEAVPRARRRRHHRRQLLRRLVGVHRRHPVQVRVQGRGLADHRRVRVGRPRHAHHRRHRRRRLDGRDVGAADAPLLARGRQGRPLLLLDVDARPQAPLLRRAHRLRGCHAVSRDGKKVAATFGGGDGYAGMVDGSNGQQYILRPDTSQSRYAWNFATFSPDGSQMITNWQGRLALRDAQTGALIREISPQLYGAKAAVMPEWSPDGEKIAFVGIPPEGAIGREISTFGNAGTIMAMPVNGGNFGPAEVVVPSTRNATASTTSIRRGRRTRSGSCSPPAPTRARHRRRGPTASTRANRLMS